MSHCTFVQSISCAQFFVTHGLQHARLPCSSLCPGACSDSCPLSRWCHPTISSPVIPFSSCPQSFPTWGSFPKILLFTSGGRSIGASTSASVLSMNIQGWFPSGLIARCAQLYVYKTIIRGKLIGTESHLVVTKTWKEQIMGRYCLVYMGFLSEEMMSWHLIKVMVAQYYECSNCH